MNRASFKGISVGSHDLKSRLPGPQQADRTVLPIVREGECGSILLLKVPRFPLSWALVNVLNGSESRDSILGSKASVPRGFCAAWFTERKRMDSMKPGGAIASDFAQTLCCCF